MEARHIITQKDVYTVQCNQQPNGYYSGEKLLVEIYNDRNQRINRFTVGLTWTLLNTQFSRLYTNIPRETRMCLFAIRSIRVLGNAGVDKKGILQITSDNFKHLMNEEANDDEVEEVIKPLIYRFFKKYPLDHLSPSDLFVSTNFDLEKIIDRLDYLEKRDILVSTAEQRGYPYHLQNGAMDKLELEVRMAMKEVDIKNRYFKLVKISIDVNKPFVFVLMPFNEKEFEQNIYHAVIKSTIENYLGIQCVRSDEITDPGVINDQIYTGIAKARFVIAEVTTQNPNVFYELGVAHSLDKDVFIFRQQDAKKLPFDISSIRAINYEGSDDLRVKIISCLSKHL